MSILYQYTNFIYYIIYIGKVTITMQNQNNTQKLILTGLMTAIVTIATMVISIPIPFTNGYIHLGDSMIFLSVLILGWKYGAFAAGIGSALADLMLGYVHWAPWTLCIKGFMAIAMGLVIQNCISSKKNTIIASIVTCVAWVAFNFGVKAILHNEAQTNAQALLSEAGVNDTNALMTFVNGVQSQLMWIAIIIPVLLLTVSFIIRKYEHIIVPIYQIVAMTMAGLFMVFGYYIAGGILYGNFAVSAFSIPANILQFVGGFFVATLLSVALCKTPAKNMFTYKTLVAFK